MRVWLIKLRQEAEFSSVENIIYVVDYGIHLYNKSKPSEISSYSNCHQKLSQMVTGDFSYTRALRIYLC